MTTLGRLSQVSLRDYWQNEASHFTPWLAREENIKLLEDAIGMELVIEAQEQNVGLFRADLLCRQATSDHWVLIENQIETTDHKHLGQLLTYAAGLSAVTIVWIAKEFNPEHRATLDWLNQITDDRFNFFGLEIELWRIGDSPAAPKFNLVSKPNNWTKAVSEAARSIERGALTEVRKLQLDYWTKINELLQKNGLAKPRTPVPRNYMSFTFNVRLGNVYPTLYANSRENRIGVILDITGPNRFSIYDRLFGQQAEIEAEIGQPLKWRREEISICQVFAERPNSDLSDLQQWNVMLDWHIKTFKLFRNTFCTRVKDIEQSSSGLNDLGAEAVS